MTKEIDKFSVELARCDGSIQQQTDLFPETTAELLQHINMPWTIIEHLFENDILSKLPKPDDVLPPIHRQEIIFVYSITKSGLDISSIKNLLIGLNKPYVYDIGRMEYDWSKSQWISKPEVSLDMDCAVPLYHLGLASTYFIRNKLHHSTL